MESKVVQHKLKKSPGKSWNKIQNTRETKLLCPMEKLTETHTSFRLESRNVTVLVTDTYNLCDVNTWKPPHSGSFLFYR